MRNCNVQGVVCRYGARSSKSDLFLVKIGITSIRRYQRRSVCNCRALKPPTRPYKELTTIKAQMLISEPSCSAGNEKKKENLLTICCLTLVENQITWAAARTSAYKL